MQPTKPSISYSHGERNRPLRTFFLATGNVLAFAVILVVFAIAIAPAIGLSLGSSNAIFLLFVVPLTIGPVVLEWLAPVVIVITGCLFAGNFLLYDRRGNRKVSITVQMLAIGCFFYLLFTTHFHVRPVGVSSKYSQPVAVGTDTQNDAEAILEYLARECRRYAECNGGVLPADIHSLTKFMVDSRHKSDEQAAEYERTPLQYYGRDVHMPAPSEPVVDRYDSPNRFVDGDLITWIWPKPFLHGKLKR